MIVLSWLNGFFEGFECMRLGVGAVFGALMVPWVALLVQTLGRGACFTSSVCEKKERGVVLVFMRRRLILLCRARYL